MLCCISVFSRCFFRKLLVKRKTVSAKETAKVKETSKPKTTSHSKLKTSTSSKPKSAPKDTIAPEIKVSNGEIIRGSTYTATGYYSVSDNKTSSPKVTIDGSVDPNTEGEYTITITARDDANNTSTASYVITVTAPTCDGSSVTVACVLDGVRYNRYIYHPAVPQQSHTEARYSTEEVASCTCTLCMNDTW